MAVTSKKCSAMPLLDCLNPPWWSSEEKMTKTVAFQIPMDLIFGINWDTNIVYL